MKIQISSARDGGTITIDGERVGYLEHYRGDSTYVRFATHADPEYLAYGTTEAVARCRGGMADAKRWVKKALKAADGDFIQLARLGAGNVWGTDAIDFFAQTPDTQRVIDDRVRASARMQKIIREQSLEIAALKATIVSLGSEVAA